MSEEAELSNRAVGRAAIWATLANASGQLLALVTFLVLARLISPAEFGAVAIALTVVEVFKQVGVDPPAMAVLSKEKPTERDFSTCLIVLVTFSTLISLGLFFGAEAFAELLGRPRVADAMEPIALVLLILGLSRTHEAWLTRRMMFRALLIRTLAAAIVGGAVGIGLALQGYGLWALVGQQWAYGITSMIAFWVFSRWRPSFQTSRAEIIGLVDFARHVGVGGAFNVLGKQADIVVAGAVLGLDRAGIYNGAKRLNLAMQLMLNSALNQIALPSLARLSTDPDQMRAAVLKALGIVSFIAAPAYLGIAAIAPDLVAVLFGPAWADVGPVLAIVSLAGAFHALEEIVVAIFLAKERPRWHMYFNIATSLANLVVILIAAPFGLMALAGAYAARVALAFPIVLSFALKLVDVPLHAGLRAIAGGFLSAIAMAATVLAVGEAIADWSAFVRLPLLILVGALAYLAFSALLNRRVLMEMTMIARQIASRAHPST